MNEWMNVDDHLHCCPTGYTCDIEHSRCQKGFQQSSNVVCPGGSFKNDWNFEIIKWF